MKWYPFELNYVTFELNDISLELSKIEKVPRDIRRAQSGKITTSSEKDWSQQVEHMQVPKERDQVSGGVSAPCRIFLWNCMISPET